ncbi:hypothetical protein CC79DRAFT_1337333 [Sarocladium strictum]
MNSAHRIVFPPGDAPWAAHKSLDRALTNPTSACKRPEPTLFPFLAEAPTLWLVGKVRE